MSDLSSRGIRCIPGSSRRPSEQADYNVQRYLPLKFSARNWMNMD